MPTVLNMLSFVPLDIVAVGHIKRRFNLDTVCVRDYTRLMSSAVIPI